MNSRTDTNTTRHTVHRPTRDEFIRCGFAQRIAYDKSTARSRTTWRRTDFGISTGSMRKANRMDTETSGELITVQEAADRLAVSRWTVYQLIWDQRVKSVQIGRCRRIVRRSFDEYLSGLIEGAA
jgi:excisionase family DNA binding protein